jgi:hypothetical protein
LKAGCKYSEFYQALRQEFGFSQTEVAGEQIDIFISKDKCHFLTLYAQNILTKSIGLLRTIQTN